MLPGRHTERCLALKRFVTDRPFERPVADVELKYLGDLLRYLRLLTCKRND
jgi:hypothetical protein